MGNNPQRACRRKYFMKKAVPILAFLTWPITLVAENSDTSPIGPPKASAHLSAMVRAQLPGFTPHSEESTRATAETAQTPIPDPDVLQLPKVTVRERPPPRTDPLDILIKSERKRKLARDFKDSLKGLDGLLNGFSFPIFSPSMAERGRTYHQQQQLDELNRVSNAIRESNPKAADNLQKDVAEAQRALDRQNRPAGSK